MGVPEFPPHYNLAAGILPWLCSIVILPLAAYVLWRPNNIHKRDLYNFELTGFLTSDTSEHKRRRITTLVPPHVQRSWGIDVKNIKEESLDSALKKALEYAQFRQHAYQTAFAYLALAIFVLIGLIFSYLYGSFLYDRTDRWIGGGKPASIVLTFKDSITPSSLGVSMDPNHPNRSVTMLSMAELVDGILVGNPTNGETLALKNEYIASIIDDTFTEIIVSASPTPPAPRQTALAWYSETQTQVAAVWTPSPTPDIEDLAQTELSELVTIFETATAELSTETPIPSDTPSPKLTWGERLKSFLDRFLGT